MPPVAATKFSSKMLKSQKEPKSLAWNAPRSRLCESSNVSQRFSPLKSQLHDDTINTFLQARQEEEEGRGCHLISLFTSSFFLYHRKEKTRWRKINKYKESEIIWALLTDDGTTGDGWAARSGGVAEVSPLPVLPSFFLLVLLFLPAEISHDPKLWALPPKLHVMPIVVWPWKQREYGSVCLYTSAAWRRRAGGGTRWSDDCERRPIDVDVTIYIHHNDSIHRIICGCR